MLLMMIGNGETVNLLLNRRNKSKCTAVWINLNFTAVIGNSTGAVLTVLHHTENRHVNIHFLYNRQNGIYLWLTAVKQNQIRHNFEGTALIVLVIMLKASCKNFIHWAYVILSLKAFYGEFFICFFHRSAVMKYHHTGNIICTEGVGNIVAFNVFGRFIKTEQFCQLLQSRHFSSKSALCLCKMLVSVFDTKIYNCQMLALLRMNKLNLFTPFWFKELSQQLLILNFAINGNSWWNIITHWIILLN